MVSTTNVMTAQRNGSPVIRWGTSAPGMAEATWAAEFITHHLASVAAWT
jgi:hypothetical protein